MRSVLIITFTICTIMIGQSQTVQYTFDDCGLGDASGQYPDATSDSTPDCECGLVANGLYFDGNMDNVVFDEGLDSLLLENFTLSFYFRIDDATDNTDLLSIRSDCDFDSLLSLVYSPPTNEIKFQVGNSISDLKSIALTLNPARCWHRVVITKVDLVYTLYLDDDFGSFVASTTANFAKGAVMSLSNSPCLSNSSVSRFNGWIDEFVIYPRALSYSEVLELDLRPDQILTGDTTIIHGASVDVTTGVTCAQNFTWSPISSIDDPTALDITVTPDVTTVYQIQYENSGGCSTTDTITIFVLEDGDLVCDNLLVPNAFTPNGDLLNDTYGISNLFIIDNLEYFEIYDRLGAKVWETTRKAERWDGSYRGNMLNPGMYIYKIKYTCNEEEFVKINNFSILR